MEKVKIFFRNISFFAIFFSISILPTLMFRTNEEVNLLFKMPAYWIISVFIALMATRRYTNSIEKPYK